MTGAPPVDGLLRLDGRRCLVTGSSRGIGAAIARRLAEAGSKVVVHASEESDALRALAEELRHGGDGPAMACADLGDAKQRDGLVKAVSLEHGPIDVLVNNAAIQPVAPLAGLNADEVDRMLAVNLAAPLLLTRDFARQAKSGGSVVNVSSIEAMVPAAGHSHYAAAKAGLSHMTRAAALELGGMGVRVNAVCPGLVDRPGLAEDWPDGVARWLEKAPLGRLAGPVDVADAVLFFAGDASRFVTGACLTVDGGMTCVPGW